jgi:DNA-binding MarR family transcriptional regulator
MSDEEVREIAQSAASHAPGNASTVAPEVLEALASLEKKAQNRPKKGIASHSRWAVYRTLLDCAKHHDRMHRGVVPAVRISLRQLAEDAGVSKPTVLKALEGLDERLLVYRLSSGEGTKPDVLVLRVPRRGAPLPIRTTSPAPPTGKATPPQGRFTGYGAGTASASQQQPCWRRWSNVPA